MKGVASDLFAQKVVERKDKVVWKRTLAFTLFGAIYLGAYGQFKYSALYPWLFGTAKTTSVIAMKVLTDLLISAPLIYFPCYFLIKGLIFGPSPLAALSQFRTVEGFALLRRYWFVWTPTLAVMWCVVPAHMRVPFICSISLVWQVMLSIASYRLAHDEPPPDAAAATAPEPAESSALHADADAAAPHSSRAPHSPGRGVARRSSSRYRLVPSTYPVHWQRRSGSSSSQGGGGAPAHPAVFMHDTGAEEAPRRPSPRFGRFRQLWPRRQ